MKYANKLDQYLTPGWAAQMLVQRFFPRLSSSDIVWEPTCGDGRFLLAVPDHVQAFGCEIDPRMAESARANTGREIIVGDCLTADLPYRPTAVIGNPPYSSELVQALLDRCYEELGQDNCVGLVLPVYMFQTASSVVRYHHHWSISYELIPRNLFQGMSKPILFARFAKEAKPKMHGFFLYSELDALTKGISPKLRGYLIGNLSSAHSWRDAVRAALEACGGSASLTELYNCFETGGRPTSTRFWREKVRQVARKHFKRTAPAEYSLFSSSVTAPPCTSVA